MSDKNFCPRCVRLTSRLARSKISTPNSCSTSFMEDTLLAAMENAGAENMLDDAELQTASVRKGLGTSATRAGVIEKLIIRSSFREREAWL